MTSPKGAAPRPRPELSLAQNTSKVRFKNPPFGPCWRLWAAAHAPVAIRGHDSRGSPFMIKENPMEGGRGAEACAFSRSALPAPATQDLRWDGRPNGGAKASQPGGHTSLAVLGGCPEPWGHFLVSSRLSLATLCTELLSGSFEAVEEALNPWPAFLLPTLEVPHVCWGRCTSNPYLGGSQATLGKIKRLS